MDIWDKKKRSEMMSRIRSEDTRPEKALRKALFAEGYRYRTHYGKLPGKPDIVLPKHKTAIFVNGCFWHGHENCKFHRMPKSNVEYWEKKIAKNKERDKRNMSGVASEGWKVIVVWECEISKKNMRSVIAGIMAMMSEKSAGYVLKIYEEVEGEIAKVSEETFFYGQSGNKGDCAPHPSSYTEKSI
jgi:DNA mismatch endonuclease (patch repair protein)